MRLQPLQDAVIEMHKEITDAGKLRRERYRKTRIAKQGVMPANFMEGYFVLIANVNAIQENKLKCKWSDPGRIYKVVNEWVYDV